MLRVGVIVEFGHSEASSLKLLHHLPELSSSQTDQLDASAGAQGLIRIDPVQKSEILTGNGKSVDYGRIQGGKGPWKIGPVGNLRELMAYAAQVFLKSLILNRAVFREDFRV